LPKNLFFDEADALFGRRSEVKDAHDRYANIEVAYLLQALESYEGLTILATNFRHNMDEAFVRRLAFIVSFPYPEEAERRRKVARLFHPLYSRLSPWVCHRVLSYAPGGLVGRRQTLPASSGTTTAATTTPSATSARVCGACAATVRYQLGRLSSGPNRFAACA